MDSINHLLNNSITYRILIPLQNWLRSASTILGTVFLYADYKIPVKELRKQLNIILTDHPKWDKRFASIRVTESREHSIELLIIVSCSDPSVNHELQVEVQERIIDFINRRYPHCFVKSKVEGVLID